MAEDYGRYLQNKNIIDAMIQLDPTSSFAADNDDHCVACSYDLAYAA